MAHGATLKSTDFVYVALSLSTNENATVMTASRRRLGRSYQTSNVVDTGALIDAIELPLDPLITNSYFSLSPPVGAVTMPPDACFTTTVVAVILRGNATSTSSLVALLFSDSVVLNTACQS